MKVKRRNPNRTKRDLAAIYGVKDTSMGIPTPWWRRLIQRFTRG